MKLTYADYCKFHAQKCKICSGHASVKKDNVWFACGCQYNASAKWRFDQIQIYPDGLKYKTWQDFTGVGPGGKLTDPSFVESKAKALKYCFGSTDPNVVSDRTKYLCIDNHLNDGQNVIITGVRSTGKTLISSLILKEIVYACAIKRLKLTFQWVKASQIIDAARWTSFSNEQSKSIDYDFLDELADVDFLFIDGLDLPPEQGDHRQPPDMLSLNNLFGHRLSHKKPTIIMCGERLWNSMTDPTEGNNIRTKWGEEMFYLLSNPNNCVINLRKEKVV